MVKSFLMNLQYEYQAIVTNIDYLTPVEIFDDYNQRCNIQNKIDELKNMKKESGDVHCFPKSTLI